MQRMCHAKKRELPSPARLYAWGAASYALCRLRKPHPANIPPKPCPVTSNSPVAAAALQQASSVTLNHTPVTLNDTPPGGSHCRAGHFPAYAKTGHRRIPMTCFPLCRRLPIFPGRFQPSIFGASELNCRVRDGNGCTLTAISTDYIYQRVFHPMISASASFIP